ncbi:ferrous iron transport protein B [Magnetovibrio sp. PR-2]|uniref:ferrous iron transport protein B n=1 Tax=Magnetovibrio sp. PR-2 TaxID=3120356 RepID=UPI002FCE39AF
MSNKTITVALVGNPNAGKTTLSNALTGSKDSVGNYPRVTVSKRENTIEYKGWTINLVDLPGIYSLTSQSPEERIGRDFIQNERPDIVLNVLDGGTLDRSLFLTTQLIEMGRPRVYALNMADEMLQKGYEISTDDLSSMLNGAVVKTVATKGEGLTDLLDAIVARAQSGLEDKPMGIPYDHHLEEAIERVQGLIADLHPGKLEARQSRWLAIKLLEGDNDMLKREDDHEQLIEMVRRERFDLAKSHSEDVETMFADSRYGFIHGLMSEARTRTVEPGKRMATTKMLDSVLLHRTLGLPLFLGLMWLMFETTFTVGAYPMDWIDGAVGFISDLVAGILPDGMVKDLIVEGIIAGVGGTIIFLPNIVILFFFLAFFSETGYLARSAFLLDRFMHSFGLHGKAFIPLVMGFGCNVPAIMATRTIESDRARLIAILINPFMACTARLPVFILFAGAFFAQWAGTIVFLMYMLSILIAFGAAVFLGRFVVHGASEPFVMELPPYRMPSLRAVVYHMWEKAADFLRKVAGIIFIGSIVLWFLQAFPKDVNWSQDYEGQIAVLEAAPESEVRDAALSKLELEMGREHLEKSYLGRAALTVSPIFEPLGFNWKDTVAILTGIVAKEVVVASYAVIYSQGEDATEESDSLRDALSATMNPLVAFAFMVFVLIYVPCLATIAVIKREAGSWKWAGFSVGFSMSLAWLLAFAIVSIGRVIA